MNNTNTLIEPNSVVTTRVATSFRVNCQSLILFKTASFLIYLLDANGGTISTSFLNLTQEQYLQWNNDDDYIIGLVCAQLGVTQALPEVTPEITSEVTPEVTPEVISEVTSEVTP